MTNPDALNCSSKSFLLRFILFLTGCAVVSWLLLTIPLDRNPGLIARQKLVVLPALFFLAFAAAKARRAGLRLGLSWLMYAAFLLPLIGLWNSGSSDQYIFAGSIPFSDAFIHQNSVLRYLYGGTMGQSSAVRPLSLLFYAGILYLSGNHFYLLYALTAAAIALLALNAFRLIARRFGPVAAAVFWVHTFFYVRRFIGTFMTEPVAVAVGLAALCLLIVGLSEKRTGVLIFGLSALSLALNLRPAAVLMLATAGLWFYGVWLRRVEPGRSCPEWKRILIAGFALAAMLLPVWLNGFAGKCVYEPGALLTNNQAYEILYGLCLGGKDAYHAMFRTELTTAFGTDEALPRLLGLCAAEFRARPENIRMALEAVWLPYLFDPERGFFSYFDGARPAFVEGFRYGLMALWTAGLALLVRRRKDVDASFWLAAVFGIFISRFILPPNYFRLRYDAATNWVAGFILAVGAQTCFNGCVQRWVFSRRERPAFEAEAQRAERCAALPSALFLGVFALMIAAALGPFRAYPEPVPAKSGRRCADGSEPWLTRIEPGNFVVLRNYDLPLPHAPAYHLNYVRPGLHDTSASETFEYTDALSGEMTIFSGLNLETFDDLTVFADWPLPADSAGFVEVCGTEIDPPLYRRYHYVEASEVRGVEAP